MPHILRRTFAILIATIGVFFVATFQQWGMILMRRIGFERALGEEAVRQLGDGRVLLTNPLGMLMWSLPFMIFGVYLFMIGIRTWRGGNGSQSPNANGK